MRIARSFLIAGGLFAGLLQAQEVLMDLQLTNPISTSSSRRGDLVSARVLSPANLQGDTVEGRITECQSGAKMGGKSVLAVGFDTLRHGGQAIPITSQVRSATNSKGQANVGEEGRIVRYGGGNVAKAGAATGVGALIGRAAGGGRGAAIGAAAGAVTSIAIIQMAADGPSISFNAGSRFVISAGTRSGPALASLPANAPAAPATQQPVAAAISTTPPAAPPQSAAAAPAAQAGPAQPNFVAVKADFVPGDPAVFVDDFTDMPGDAPPPHWKVRGGTAELRMADGLRQIAMNARRTVLTPNVTALPKNFTMEIDMFMKGHGGAVEWRFRDKAGKDAMFMRFAVNYKSFIIVHRVGAEQIISQQIPMDYSRPIKQALWLQNGRMRLYINGERIYDVNQINVADLGVPEASIIVEQPPGKIENYIAFQYARFAESMPDFSQVIMANGRYVTHGILFDTDSDRIQPESGPVIKQIARALETNPALKLLIEGHTDSVGQAAHNIDLSKRRAEAVKTVLVGQFNIATDRLGTAGLGASKPIDSNDTPQGRAQNRRVELVRQ